MVSVGGSDLAAMISYDFDQILAARACGIPVEHPGQP